MALAQHGQQNQRQANEKTGRCKQNIVEDSDGLTAVPVCGERSFKGQSELLQVSIL